MFAFMDRWVEETGANNIHVARSSSNEDTSLEKEMYLLDLAAGRYVAPQNHSA
jgi:hypothetical protein